MSSPLLESRVIPVQSIVEAIWTQVLLRAFSLECILKLDHAATKNILIINLIIKGIFWNLDKYVKSFCADF